MATYAGGFVSTNSIQEKRDIKRKAREEVLNKAKKQYEKEEQREKQRKARGEDTWMLPEIEQRLQQMSEEHLGKDKKKKKKEKSKKKKEKKKKDKKEKSHDNGSSGSSEDSDEWVEAPLPTGGVNKAWKLTEPTDIPAPLDSKQRDEWMTFDFLALKTTSVNERREQKEAEKEAKREEAQSLEQAGLHRLELNPYWKDGGSGLPPEHSAGTSVTKARTVDDGGRSWLLKSYQRMKEQAEREKRSLNDVVAERYGSMEQFEKRLQEADVAAFTQKRDKDQNRSREESGRSERWRREPYRNMDQDDDRGKQRAGNQDKETITDQDRKRERDRDRDLKRDRQQKWDHARDRNRDRGQEWDKDRERERDQEKNTDRRMDREREKERNHNNQRERDRGRFLKPSDINDMPSPGAGFMRPGSSSSLKFLKPVCDDEDVPVWRKVEEKKTEKMEVEEKKECSPTQAESRSESEEEEVEKEEEKKEVPLLTDEEMNKLGAKLLKAELMGNTSLMDSLKAQLDAARKARENQKNKPKQVLPSQQAEKEMVLFRTDQLGQAWPVADPAQHLEPKGGRRKKKPIETHVAGERVRYFADDDGLDLKEMVRREKMSSAQDQNALYSRMAAKMMGKQDGDNYTLDDMFVSSAAQKQRTGLDDERGRNRAMEEGRSLAVRMDKCAFCFSNSELPKHLVVAIGAKVYLCLPNCVSLTEGHCFIAPLQHHCCSTNLDEDVWNEVQMFRRSLVRMFESLELDCVFLETYLNPRRRLHMLYECVPLPRELGDMAPVYFKKAILECDEEWAMNKKLVDLSSKNIKQAVPRGLPYFSVDFGLQGGFAHVIENQDKFPHYFGKEVLGGMLDLEPRRWRKPIRENFDDQRKKVLQFSQWWKPFDCTKTNTQ